MKYWLPLKLSGMWIRDWRERQIFRLGLMTCIDEQMSNSNIGVEREESTTRL